MQIRIRDMLAIEWAEFELSRITIIAGLNARGKSSIVETAAAALAQSPLMRGITKKGEASLLVRRGQAAGSVEIEDEHGAVKIEYPKASLSSTGAQPPRSSAVAAGIVQLTELKAADRAKYIFTLLDAVPDEAAFKVALAKGGISDDGAAKAWALVQEQGWDALHKARQEKGAQMKGAWEQVTIESYGQQKAEGWLPKGYDPLRADWTDSQWDEAVATQRSEVEKLVGAGAVNAAEYRRRQAQVERGSNANLELDGRTLAQEKAQLKVKGARELKASLAPLPTDIGMCPHCQKPIAPRIKDPQGRWIIDPVETDMSQVQLKELRAKHADAEAQIAEAQRELEAAIRATNETKRVIAEASEAVAWIKASPPPDDDATESPDLIAAREALRTLQVAKEAATAKRTADRLKEQIKGNQVLIDVLAPNGLRQQRAAEVVALWVREVVDPLTEAWKMSPITFDADLEVSVGGTPFERLAESEQWRVNVLLQLAVAIKDGSAAVVIDRADILLPDLRRGLFQILQRMEIPALVAMAARAPEIVPRLQDAGMGHSYWVDRGTLVEVPSKEKAA